jgi:hypothetical protein
LKTNFGFIQMSFQIDRQKCNLTSFDASDPLRIGRD